MPPRQVPEAVFYVPQTGIQRKALPKAYGAAGRIHEYFSERAEAGFFRRMWQEGLLTYDEVRGPGREWQSMDGRMVEAPPARDVAGRTPADRGKKGAKRRCGGQSPGLPAGIVLDGANRHEVKLLEDTLKSIVTAHPDGAKVCLDGGYAGSQKVVEGMGYEAHIRPREKRRVRRKRILSGGWWKYAIHG
jgi:uncharacterized protein YwbE